MSDHDTPRPDQGATLRDDSAAPANTSEWSPKLHMLVWSIDGPEPFGGLRAVNLAQAQSLCDRLNHAERRTPALTPHQVADVTQGIIDDLADECTLPDDIRSILIGRLACITNGDGS